MELRDPTPKRVATSAQGRAAHTVDDPGALESCMFGLRPQLIGPVSMRGMFLRPLHGFERRPARDRARDLGGTLLSIATGKVPAAAPAPGLTPLEWLEHWVRELPGAPAVVEADRTLTYGELSARAEELQVALSPFVRRGDCVGVALPRGVGLVATALALARLGCTYIPVGDQQPAARLAKLQELADMTLVVTEDRHSAVTCPVLHMRGDGTVDAVPSASPVIIGEGAIDAGQEAPPFYGIFTSGSTGEAKLVSVGERQLAGLLRWYCSTYHCGPGARVSLLVSPTFDVHLMELWAALATGSTLVVIPDEVRADPDELLRMMAAEGITTSFLPTPIAEMVDARPWPPDMALRDVQVGGDRLGHLPAARPGVSWHNLYGPAEATVVTVALALEELKGSPKGEAPPIGRPVDGTTVAVVDTGRVVPRGVCGELWLAGDLLSLGYSGRPDLTAERFPTVDLKGTCGPTRYYVTGDRVHMDEEGLVHFHGRVDDQVKVRGVRIEPAEVEAALRGHGAVSQAIVMADRSSSAETRLLAFYTLRLGATVAEFDLSVWLRSHLPPYLRPDVVMQVQDIPLTENGKIDRRALGDLAARTRPRVYPRRVSARSIWDEELPAAGTDFANAGGTSLIALRIAARTADELGVRVRAGQLMRETTFEAYARQVAQGLASST